MEDSLNPKTQPAESETEKVKLPSGWDNRRSGTFTNQVASAITSINGKKVKPDKEDFATGTKTYKGGEFSLAPSDFSKLVEAKLHTSLTRISPSTRLVWNLILTRVTELGTPKGFSVNYEGLQEVMGISDYKTFNLGLWEDIKALSELSILYQEKIKGEKKVSKKGDVPEVYEKDKADFHNILIHIFADVEINTRSKTIKMHFTERAHRALKRCSVNPFPTALYNDTDRVKNPNRQMLIEVFQNAMAMNLGKSNEGVFSVDNLLKVTAYPLPKEGTLKGFHFDRDLLKPFEADMDSLAPSIKWCYIETEEVPSTYESFIQAKIKISWAEYPRELIEARKERNRSRAEEAKAEDLVEKAEAIVKVKKEKKKADKCTKKH